eukprot:CAMPEP_0175904318 /NCGR_PEP_ID=MMETSP0108-20121206/4405_1 /TAXON_ID=195067 ORGANISM="Goniomonas pacifica, Strain CCMP1869" /NCGR_SAMPLE_ID=MMETSP0108 /ASSEMBLY_ACC=CAM_ASM_000204 /LENGTH=524 /DNA_ID=CAMNT_0017226107 /DNA_START=17 /DNA_END=1592 /DNA_ORIENTATION=+
MASAVTIKRVKPEDVPTLRRDPVDPKAREVAAEIVENVKTRGLDAVLEYAVKFGELTSKDEAVVVPQAELKAAFESLAPEQQGVLTRTAARITKFAQAQRASISETTTAIDGGEAGQTVSPVATAGCYAPGGRYPLPSTVLMTVCTARVAGVPNVWVASPRPTPVTLAAAHVAGADGLLRVGGAHAIAAMAFGAGPIPTCDAVVGPGNAFVTAAKSLVAGRVAIDMLAGPSECLVYADETADAATVASDLLAQAEHDVQALPILVASDEAVVAAVEAEVNVQLATLPTADVAAKAFEAAFAVIVSSVEEGVAICVLVRAGRVAAHLVCVALCQGTRDSVPRVTSAGFIIPRGCLLTGQHTQKPTKEHSPSTSHRPPCQSSHHIQFTISNSPDLVHLQFTSSSPPVHLPPDRLAPEHLELHLRNANEVAKQVDHYGGLFVGHNAAEVLGDYGAGPNHTLPTGGTARSMGGLSVMTFLRVRTWMRVDDAAAAQQMVSDAVALGEMEGLMATHVLRLAGNSQNDRST